MIWGPSGTPRFYSLAKLPALAVARMVHDGGPSGILQARIHPFSVAHNVELDRLDDCEI